MKTLKVDKVKCNDCGECATMLPDLLVLYHGEVSISSAMYKDDRVQAAIKDAIGVCPEGAISVVQC